MGSSRNCIVRFKLSNGKSIRFRDLVLGERNAICSAADPVLLRQNGLPTPYLANVVDDHFMQISHVIRNERWLSTMPKHIQLYEAFGWPLPSFAHLPRLLNGSVSVQELRQGGVYKEAILNYICNYGGAVQSEPEPDRLLWSLDYLCDQFCLEKICKTDHRVAIKNPYAINCEINRKRPVSELVSAVRQELKAANILDQDFSDDFCERLARMFSYNNHISGVGLLLRLKNAYIWQDPPTISGLTPEDREFLAGFLDTVKSANLDMRTAVSQCISQFGKNEKCTLRRILTGRPNCGPPLVDIVELLGANKVAKRVEVSLNYDVDLHGISRLV